MPRQRRGPSFRAVKNARRRRLLLEGDEGPSDFGPNLSMNPSSFSTSGGDQTYPAVSGTVGGPFVTPDGAYLFAFDNTNNNFERMSMSTPYDFSTLTDDAVTWPAATNTMGTAFGCIMSEDGTMFWGNETGDDEIQGTSCSTPYDISTCGAPDDTFSYTNEIALAQGASWIGDSGTKLYVAAANETKVAQYNLGGAWDVSTGSHAATKSDLNSASRGIIFDNTGTRMYSLGGSGFQWVESYTLSTAWDITSATYDGDAARLDTGTGGNGNMGLACASDGTKTYMYISHNGFNLCQGFEATI